MTDAILTAATSWPDAVVGSVALIAIAAVLAVAIWRGLDFLGVWLAGREGSDHRAKQPRAAARGREE
jgi:hypothetical protein